MASNIESFLKLRKKQTPTKSVTVKVQDQNLEFDIKALEPELISEIQLAHTVAIPSSVQGGAVTEGANPLKLSLDLLNEAIIAPNLNDAELQNQFEVFNSRDLLYELFKHDMDSLGVMVEEIIALSTGEDAPKRGTDPEDVKKAKNS